MDEEDWEDFAGGSKRIKVQEIVSAGSDRLGRSLLKSVGFSLPEIDVVSDPRAAVKNNGVVIFGARKKASVGSKMAGGFGLGALEDEDEDDQDVYDRGDMGFHDEDHEEDDQYSRKGSSLLARVKVDWSKMQPLKGHNSVIPGFVQCSKLIVFESISTSFEIPTDWNPAKLEVKKGSSRSGYHLDAKARGSILGEEELYGGRQGSRLHRVEDEEEYEEEEEMKMQGRTEIAEMSHNIEGCSWLTAYPNLAVYTKLEPSQALSALQGYQPFQKTNPEKQLRYFRFLNASMNPSLWRDVVFPATFLEGDIAKELEEFSMAARVYQPMGASMASRFTRATSSEDRRPSEESKKAPMKQSSDFAYEREAVFAKRMGMGLTRVEREWTPSGLLCKRFNVQDPHPDKASSSWYTGSETGSAMSSKMLLAPETILPVLSDHLQMQKRNVKVTDVKPAHDDEESEEELADEDQPLPERPNMSLFHSIFGADSIDSSDDEE